MRLKSLRSADPERASIPLAEGLTVVDWLTDEERTDAAKAIQWFVDQQAPEPRSMVLHAFQVPVLPPAITEEDVAVAAKAQAEASGKLATLISEVRECEIELESAEQRQSALTSELDQVRQELDPLARERYEEAVAALHAMRRRLGVSTDGTIRPRDLLVERLADAEAERETLAMAIGVAQSVDVDSLRAGLEAAADSQASALNNAVAVLAGGLPKGANLDLDEAEALEAAARSWLDAVEEARADLPALEAKLAEQDEELAEIQRHIDLVDPDAKVVLGVDPELPKAVSAAEVAEKRLAGHETAAETISDLVAMSDQANERVESLLQRIDELEARLPALETARSEAVEDHDALRAQHEIDLARISPVLTWMQEAVDAVAAWGADAPCTVILDGVFDGADPEERTDELRNVLAFEDRIQIIVFADDPEVSQEVRFLRFDS